MNNISILLIYLNIYVLDVYKVIYIKIEHKCWRINWLIIELNNRISMIKLYLYVGLYNQLPCSYSQLIIFLQLPEDDSTSISIHSYICTLS